VFERAACKFGVRIVTRADHDQIYVRIVEHFIRARNRKTESETLANVVR